MLSIVHRSFVLVDRHEAKPHFVDSTEALALKGPQDIESDTRSTGDEDEEVSVEFSTQESGREAFLSANGDVEAGHSRKGYWNGIGLSRKSSSVHNDDRSSLFANGHGTEDSGVEMSRRVRTMPKVNGASGDDNYQDYSGANGDSGGCSSGHSHDHDHGHSHDHDNHHGHTGEHRHFPGGRSMNIWAVLVHAVSDAISSGIVCVQGTLRSGVSLGVLLFM